jgi:hypothetical protein
VREEPELRDPLELLRERQQTHGEFGVTAGISQALKREFAKAELSDVHRECLDMIAVKISRILAGDARYRDHWDDIAGYAKLGSEACSD